MPQADGLQFTVRVGELPEDVFSVVGFSLTEALSELFHGRLGRFDLILGCAVIPHPRGPSRFGDSL